MPYRQGILIFCWYFCKWMHLSSSVKCHHHALLKSCSALMCFFIVIHSRNHWLTDKYTAKTQRSKTLLCIKLSNLVQLAVSFAVWLQPTDERTWRFLTLTTLQFCIPQTNHFFLINRESPSLRDKTGRGLSVISLLSYHPTDVAHQVAEELTFSVLRWRTPPK